MYSLYGSFVVDTKDSEVSFDIFKKVKKKINLDLNLISNIPYPKTNGYMVTFKFIFNRKDFRNLLFSLLKFANILSSNWLIVSFSTSEDKSYYGNCISLICDSQYKNNFFDERITWMNLELSDNISINLDNQNDIDSV